MSVLSTGRQASLPKESRTDALTSAVFQIEDDQGGTAVFSELGGINSEVETVEYMESGVRGPMFGRFLGKAKPPTVTLKRAMSTGNDTTWIWSWHSMARTGAVGAYRTTTLKLFSAGTGETPQKTYMLVNAVPTKVDIAGMKAGGSEVVLQTLTLQCDEIIEGP